MKFPVLSVSMAVGTVEGGSALPRPDFSIR